MDVYHPDKKLERLEYDEDYDAGFSAEVVRMYRKRMQLMRAARDERDFYALKSLHYEKLKGKRSHQRSMRLNARWRVILEIKPAKPKNIIIVVSIEDYH